MISKHSDCVIMVSNEVDGYYEGAIIFGSYGQFAAPNFLAEFEMSEFILFQGEIVLSN